MHMVFDVPKNTSLAYNSGPLQFAGETKPGSMQAKNPFLEATKDLPGKVVIRRRIVVIGTSGPGSDVLTHIHAV